MTTTDERRLVSGLELALEEKDGALTGAHSIRHALKRFGTTTGWIRGRVNGRTVKLETQHAQMTLEVSRDGRRMTGYGQSTVSFTVDLARQD